VLDDIRMKTNLSKIACPFPSQVCFSESVAIDLHIETVEIAMYIPATYLTPNIRHTARVSVFKHADPDRF
jgi:hypothetical protein